MAEIRTLYGTASSLPATGFATLANSSSANSNFVPNTSNFLDVLLMVTVTTGASAVSGGVVEIWVKASIDNSTYDDDSNDKWVGTISLPAAGAQTRSRSVSIASAFMGTMPPYWMVRFKNATGAALTDASVVYQGIAAQTV